MKGATSGIRHHW